ncbi:hypothetical protein DDB_G0294286, partial [Dictyostelium discoideum AX4]
YINQWCSFPRFVICYLSQRHWFISVAPIQMLEELYTMSKSSKYSNQVLFSSGKEEYLSSFNNFISQRFDDFKIILQEVSSFNDNNNNNNELQLFKNLKIDSNLLMKYTDTIITLISEKKQNLIDNDDNQFNDEVLGTINSQIVFMDYLTHLFKHKPPLAFSTINGHSSMLNQLLLLRNQTDIVNDPFITRIITGIHKLRPSSAKYKEIWDANQVFKHLSTIKVIPKFTYTALLNKTLVLYDTNSQVCPVRLLATYLRASKGRRKPHSGDSVFVKNEGEPLEVNDINSIVLSTLSSSGDDDVGDEESQLETLLYLTTPTEIDFNLLAFGAISVIDDGEGD